MTTSFFEKRMRPSDVVRDPSTSLRMTHCIECQDVPIRFPNVYGLGDPSTRPSALLRMTTCALGFAHSVLVHGVIPSGTQWSRGIPYYYYQGIDRKRAGWGKGVDLGGRRIIAKVGY